MNPNFSQKELEQRSERAHALMRAEGLSALFITSETNFYYLSGHRPFLPWSSMTRPTFLVIPCEQSPVMITGSGWIGAARRESWFEDVRSYSELSKAPTHMIADLFHELGISRARVGVEFGTEQRMGIAYADFTELREALRDVEWVDAASTLWKLRLIKSRAEIEYMRQSGSAVMHAFGAVFPKLAPGVTQQELVQSLCAAICEAGSDPGFVVMACDRETDRPMSWRFQMEAVPLEQRQLITVDVGATRHGYWCDFNRAVSLGRPSDETLRTWEAIYRVTMKGVEAMKPGSTIAQVVRSCLAEADKQGLPTLYTGGGRIGHSLGLQVTEVPSITLEETTVLQAGMTLALEPSIQGPSGVFVVEQDVAVTEDGPDVLSDGPWEIWVA